MIQSGARRTRAVLVAVLAVELLLAGWWRWPWTAAPIQTAFDYGSGHVTVVSENWHMHGALARHLLPVMSIDRAMPEWPYRGDLAQDYISVPPLAFALHYAAMRALPPIEPVLLAKLLAQALIAASVLASALFLADAFGAVAAFAGLTFAIWGVPFLLWFANGYFAVNVGLAAQLVLAAWCGAVARWCLRGAQDGAGPRPLVHASIGAALAFAGAFADYMPLIGNALATAGFLGIAGVSWRSSPRARRVAIASAAGVAAGSAIAGLVTLGLYSAQLGVRRYLAAVALRTAQRSGTAALATHVDVIRRQMLTAWPSGVLAALAAILVVVVGVSMTRLARTREAAADGAVALFTLTVAIGPSLFFHYTAVKYVGIHWWFAGTWIVGWTIAVCAFVSLAGPHRRLRWLAIAVTAALVVADVQFTRAQPAVDEHRSESVYFYRALGAELPHDHMPLVVTDVTVDRPGLFEDFPYASAYLRRALLLRDPDGHIRLPSSSELYDGRMVTFGGENAEAVLDQRGRDVYVAYDPEARRCFGVDMPLTRRRSAIAVAVCRVSAATLVRTPDAVLGPIASPYPCSSAPPAPTGAHVSSIADHTVVLSWNGSSYTRASHILEAGRSPGQSDALTIDLGRTTTYTATNVQPGTYYVRVLAKSSCGASAPSSEVVVSVE